ncbi:MAG: PIG-L family deacetylase [Cellulophaga sp.]
MNKVIFLLFSSALILFSCKQAEKNKTVNVSGQKKTLLVILAHPDDEFFISPLLSKYNNENIYWVVAANGDLGTREFANIPAGDSLKNVRRKEALCTAEKLKINAPIFLNYGDGQINVWENFYPIREKIDSLYNLIKPDAIITWGPEGGYGHPDHRMIGNITTEVFQAKPSNEKCQLFYYAFPKSAVKSFTSFKTEGGEWLITSMLPTENNYLTYRIPYSNKDLELGLQALYCNKSQFSPDEVEEIFTLVSVSDSIYLKPYHTTNKIKYDIFE